jgi:hypothetical protein
MPLPKLEVNHFLPWSIQPRFWHLQRTIRRTCMDWTGMCNKKEKWLPKINNIHLMSAPQRNSLFCFPDQESFDDFSYP